jgi:hypothetical protein
MVVILVGKSLKSEVNDWNAYLRRGKLNIDWPKIQLYKNLSRNFIHFKEYSQERDSPSPEALYQVKEEMLHRTHLNEHNISQVDNENYGEVKKTLKCVGSGQQTRKYEGNTVTDNNFCQWCCHSGAFSLVDT